MIKNKTESIYLCNSQNNFQDEIKTIKHVAFQLLKQTKFPKIEVIKCFRKSGERNNV